MVSHFVTRIHTTFSILTYIFEAVTKLAQLHKRLHDASGFHHFPHESTRNSCLDSSARYRAENPSVSAQISVSARAGNSRNSSEKCKLSVSSTVSADEMIVCLHKCWGRIDQSAMGWWQEKGMVTCSSVKSKQQIEVTNDFDEQRMEILTFFVRSTC